jgi:hypothetical protein
MKTAGRGNPNSRATERTEFMGRKIRTILAQLSGLEDMKQSGRRRGIFLDFPFYRTSQGQSNNSAVLVKKWDSQWNSFRIGNNLTETVC